MARVNGSGFKMKSSPAKKGALSNFFSSLGKQATAGQKDRGIFSEKGKAEKKEMRKTGESKYQYDVRTRKPKPKSYSSKSQPSVDKQIEAADKRFGEGVQVKSTKTTSAPSAQEMINMAYKGTNNDWDKASKNAMDMYDITLTELIGKRNSPAEKKSPSKKRGYKMKRK